MQTITSNFAHGPKRAPRFTPRYGNVQPPFYERREQAKNLPPAYADGFAQFVSDLIDADAAGRHFTMECWTKARWGRSANEMSRRIARACQFAACDVCPTLNRHSLNRFPPHLALAAMVLPAQKQDGIFHVHGLLRVPTSALGGPMAQVFVQTDGRRHKIEAPEAIARFAHHLRTFAGGAVTSLHIDHNGASRVVDVTNDKVRRVLKLTYLTARGAEVRSWDELQFVPFAVWRRMTKGLDLAGTRTLSLLPEGYRRQAQAEIEGMGAESRSCAIGRPMSTADRRPVIEAAFG
jgi:hypothetical protein